MSGVEARFGEIGRIASNQRQFASIGEIDQPGLARRLDRIASTGDLDIEPVTEQGFQSFAVTLRRFLPVFSQQPRQRALARAGEADQAFAAPFQHRKRNMRLQMLRTIEMGGGHEMAQILPSRLVLGIERQPVDHRITR